MQFTGDRASTGVPTQPMAGASATGPARYGVNVAGVWQSSPHFLELTDGSDAHPKAMQSQMIVGVDSTVQPAPQI